MHVKDLHVERYGPMAPFHMDGLGAFTLVHGPNEQGKTLLIDALIRLLFKKELKKSQLKLFGDTSRNIGRVSEHPEGFVVLRSHAEEIKLEKDEALSTFFPFKVSPEDFRNIFLIRDSDLSVHDEREYYEQITEKLTGLRASEIEQVLKGIQRLGCLKTIAPDSPLANNIETDHIATRVKDARFLADEIRALRDQLRTHGFDELGERLVECREQIANLESERERYRVAERRSRYKRAEKALKEVKQLERTIKSMRRLDDGQLRLWQNFGVERTHVNKDMGREKRAVAKIEEELKLSSQTLENLRAKARRGDGRLQRVRESLSQPLDAYQHDRAEFRRTEAQSGFLKIAIIIGLAVGGLALVGYLITPSNIIATVGAIALMAALAAGVSARKISRSRAGLEARADALRGDAARLGLNVDTVLELNSAIGDLEDEVGAMHDEARTAENTLTMLAAEQKSASERIHEKSRRIDEIDKEEVRLQSGTGMETVDAMQTEIDKRNQVNASYDAKMELLQSLVPLDIRAEDDRIEAWENEIRKRLQEDTDAVAVKDDPDAAARLDVKIRGLKDEERDIVGRLKQGGRRLHGIEVKAAQLQVLEDTPRCRTVVELEHTGERIAAWCDQVDRQKETAQAAIAIFQEIETEEREKVGDLFGPESMVSRLFARITDGRYHSATYRPEQNRIFVEAADGTRIRATSLSGGAFDQLYLAIRLSIAEKLLPESKGFFILDDPFLKADSGRLKNLLATLKQFVDDGWQILYFSAKDEVVNALHDDIKSGNVQLIELARTLFTGEGISPPSARTGTDRPPRQYGMEF